jgi:hypothetical protein
VGHKPPKTAWLGAPKADEGCQGLPTVDREDDEISVAPGSQERVFFDEEESDHPTNSH